jgi:hypothetical protein
MPALPLHARAALRRSALAALAAFATFAPAVRADDVPRAPRHIVERLGVEIRQILAAATPDRTPEDAERAAAAQITALIRREPGHLSLTEPDARGQTALMLAANGGYPLVVDALLADPGVKLAVNAVDKRGQTAWMIANFAPALTLAACQPGALTRERYILLPPYLLRMAHLLKTQAAGLGAIVQSLEAAGAEPQPEAAKRAWLARCPNASPELRAALEQGPLMQTLVAHAIARQSEFNKTAQESVRSLPMRPPKDMRFISGEREHGARLAGAPLGIHQMVCSRMRKPEIPRISWAGEILLHATVSTNAGIVEVADIDVISVKGDKPEAAGEFFRGLVLQALAGYECEGNVVFEQQFHFSVK